ncbi:hypothetical protein [Leeuwenhoekiella marinoflava]|uniref:hypothetical protein n=1 Tax=Leeuwenhoekiella marinoflava TaxID=988 RepID=UPI003002DB8F
MTRCTLILMLLFYQVALCQTFVEDVEKVENVVITYKVDSIGKQYDIKIDSDLTTYHNVGWQKGCLEHFMNGKLKHPMRMLNEEWRAVYYFVNPKYKTSSLKREDIQRCKQFRKGEFKYVQAAYNRTRILRRRKRQIEKGGYKDQRQVYKIDWIDDNKYVLTTLKLPLDKDKEKIGNRIDVEIIEILEDNSYLYRSSSSDSDKLVFGVIKKVQ